MIIDLLFSRVDHISEIGHVSQLQKSLLYDTWNLVGRGGGSALMYIQTIWTQTAILFFIRSIKPLVKY